MIVKPSGDLRICVDYRRVNEQTVKDSHPLPNITATLDELAGARWFSSFDLVSVYYQIEVLPEDQEITAFASPYGLFQYRRMPFGLSNAPSTFQRVIDDLTQVLNMEDLVTYLDDIICFHKTFPEYLAGIRRVLEMCRNAGLKLAPHKCQLARKEISVLGHVVNREGLKPQQQKVDVIANYWPQPNSKDELSRFLGLCGYYRRFIPSFADITSSLFDAVKEDFQWTLGTPE